MRYRKLWHAAAVLEKHDISYGATKTPWYDRLPWLDSPRPIESVMILPGRDLAVVAPILANLGTVKRATIYELTEHELQLLSQIQSIESISTSCSMTADDVRPLTTLRLQEFSVYGADLNILPEALEVLFTIPTLKSVGTGAWRRCRTYRIAQETAGYHDSHDGLPTLADGSLGNDQSTGCWHGTRPQPVPQSAAENTSHDDCSDNVALRPAERSATFDVDHIPT